MYHLHGMYVRGVLSCKEYDLFGIGRHGMRLNSKVVGLIVLVVMFGGILLTAELGWWQTVGGGRGAGNHDGASESPPEVTVFHGAVSDYDRRGVTVATDEGKSFHIELGNPRSPILPFLSSTLFKRSCTATSSKPEPQMPTGAARIPNLMCASSKADPMQLCVSTCFIFW